MIIGYKTQKNEIIFSNVTFNIKIRIIDINFLYMKIKILILISFLAISISNAQNYQQALKDFDNLKLDGGNYILKKGNGQISYTPNDDYIILYNYDSITKTLNIKVRAKEKLKFKKNSAPLIELTAPSIKTIKISSAAELYVIDTLFSTNFNLETEEASFCKLAIISDTIKITANEASSIKTYNQAKNLFLSAKESSKIDINGKWVNVNIIAQEASKIDIEGQCNKLKINAEEASTVNASKLSAKIGNIIAEEASSVLINVSDTLHKVVREASSVTNSSNPKEITKANNIKNYDKLAEIFSFLFFMPFLWFFAIFLIPILLFGLFF